MPKKAPTHKPHGNKRIPDNRPSSCVRGYDGNWRKVRLMVLAREPICQDCERAPATEVDHVIALTKGGTNEMNNFRCYCKPCHSRKTCRVDNGLGRRGRG